MEQRNSYIRLLQETDKDEENYTIDFPFSYKKAECMYQNLRIAGHAANESTALPVKIHSEWQKYTEHRQSSVRKCIKNITTRFN